MAVEQINQEVEEQIEAVTTEQVVEQDNVVEMKPVHEFEKNVTIFGTVERYSWEEDSVKEMAVSFCTFNTQIDDQVYATNVGIGVDNEPMVTIKYNGEITVAVINFIVNHIMQATIEQTTSNDSIFYSREEAEPVSVDNYTVITPVLQVVGVLHSWANLACFTANEEQAAEKEIQE